MDLRKYVFTYENIGVNLAGSLVVFFVYWLGLAHTLANSFQTALLILLILFVFDFFLELYRGWKRNKEIDKVE